MTGSTGFIGKNALKGLIKNYKIIKVIRNNLYDKNRIERLIKNNKIDLTLHIAGSGIKKNKLDYAESNIKLTQKIVDITKRTGAQKIIFISTYLVDFAAYSEYGRSKKVAEQIIKNSKIDYTIIRPTVVFGKNDDRNINKLIDIISKNKIIPIIGNGKGLIQPIYIDDLIKIIILSINNFRNKTIYAAGKDVVTYDELINLIANNLNKNIIKLHIPKLIMFVLVYLQEKILKRPIIMVEQIKYIDKFRPIDMKTLDKRIKLSSLNKGIKKAIIYLKAKLIQTQKHF